METAIKKIEQAIIKHNFLSRMKELSANCEVEYDFKLYKLNDTEFIVISSLDCYRADRLYDKKFNYYFFDNNGDVINRELDFDLTEFVLHNKKISKII